jgi:hypothetical protein
MASGALLQLVSQGLENTILESEEATAFRPFTEVYRTYSPFASSIEDMQIQLPTEQIYGQEIRFSIPRKGDLLRNLYIEAYVTRSSIDPYFPLEELIDRVSVYAGRQLIEEITGDYVRLHSHLYNDNEEDNAIYQYSDFNIQSEKPGSSKTLYCRLPLFFSRHDSTSLPLISIQNQKIDVVISFKKSVSGLDPEKNPTNVRFLGEYIYLSQRERQKVVLQNQILIETVKYQRDSIVMQESQIKKTYTDNTTDVRLPTEYSRIDKENEFISEVIQLTIPPLFINEQSVFFDAGLSMSYSRTKGSMALPKDGYSSIIWARDRDLPAKQGGYEIQFRVNGQMLEIYIKRNHRIIGYIKDENVFTTTYLSIRSENNNMDISQYFFYDKLVLEFDVEHDLDDSRNTTKVLYTLHGCDNDQWLTTGTSRAKMTRYFTFSEGQLPIDLYNKNSVHGFSSSSTTEETWVTGPNPGGGEEDRSIDIKTKKMYVTPVSNNYASHSTRLFFTGALRSLIWFSNRGDQSRLGEYTPGPIATSTTRFSPMLSCRILLNSQSRCGNDFLPDVFFSAVHPCRTIRRPLPAGVHFYTASLNPKQQQPDGFINLSSISDILVQQRYRRYNKSVDQDLRKLYDNTETTAGGEKFNSAHFYGIFFNILYIENGEISIAFV